MSKPQAPGLIHVYTGPGKGKTTAALGLGLRAFGRGRRVLVVQFLKGAMSGEVAAIAGLGPAYRLARGKAVSKFTWQMDEAEKAATRADQAALLATAAAEIASGGCDLLILDEALGALESGMLDPDQLMSLVKNKPAGLELVLTGRNPPPELLALADYVSEIQAVKHPFERGIAAREGIED